MRSKSLNFAPRGRGCLSTDRLHALGQKRSAGFSPICRARSGILDSGGADAACASGRPDSALVGEHNVQLTTATVGEIVVVAEEDRTHDGVVPAQVVEHAVDLQRALLLVGGAQFLQRRSHVGDANPPTC